MKRNKKLLHKRMKLVGAIFELKRDKFNKSSKCARIEIAQLFGLHLHTINNDLTKYKKSLTNYTKKNE